MPWVSRPPSPETQQLIDDFNTFRGGYLNSFAQMEFTVGRLLSRFNVTPPFEHALDNVKYRFESRIDALENLLVDKSELTQAKKQGLVLCSRIRSTYDLRNYFAHGIVRLDVDTLVFTVRRILPEKNDPWHEVSIDIHAKQIAPELSRMSLLTQEFMHYARELSENFGLEF